MRGLQLGLIDAGSSTCRLSVLLSAMKMSLRIWTAQEIAEGASAGIISTRFRALNILAMATIRGRCFFLLGAPNCAATIRGRCLIEEKRYYLSLPHLFYFFFPFAFHSAHVVCVTPHGLRFAILSHFWMYSCSLVRHPCSVTRHLLEMSWLVSRDLWSSLWFECPGYVSRMSLYVALASKDIHLTNIYIWDSCQRIHVHSRLNFKSEISVCVPWLEA